MFFCSSHGVPGIGTDVYYRTLITKILAVKYPRAAIPKVKQVWYDTRNETGMHVSFENIIEWNLGLKISGVGHEKVIGCITYKDTGGCSIEVAEDRNGTRNVDLQSVSQPQIYNCKFCQEQHYDSSFIARLENPKDMKKLYEQVGLKHPVDIYNTRFRLYFTHTTLEETQQVYSKIPIQMVYNLIKQFEPDYKAFGYPLPFEWLQIPPVDLNEFNVTRKYFATRMPEFRTFTPLL